MKVLRVLGLILGILLVLVGGGLLAASAVAERGQVAVQQELDQQGLEGPVDGVVVRADPPTYIVQFTTEDGKQYSATAGSTLVTPAKVGDTVQIFYQADNPSVAAITDVPATVLGDVAGTLRVSGIVTLVLGAVLLAASIVGFVLARKSTALPAQAQGTSGQPGYPPQQPGPYPPQQPGHPPQQPGPYPPQQPGPYPPQQPGPYPPQQPGPYPPQPPAGNRPPQ